MLSSVAVPSSDSTDLCSTVLKNGGEAVDVDGEHIVELDDPARGWQQLTRFMVSTEG